MSLLTLNTPVWILKHPKVPSSYVNASGVITSISKAGKYTVTLNPDNAICRTHRVRAFLATPEVLTTVNPFSSAST